MSVAQSRVKALTGVPIPVHDIQVSDRSDGHANHWQIRALICAHDMCSQLCCSLHQIHVLITIVSVSRANKTYITTMASVLKAIKNIASGNKPRRLRPPNTSSDDSSTVLDPLSLPNAIPKQYPPLILIHVILLSAALVLLPQTPIPDLPLPSPTRGLDKPQLPFLAPITARPVLTLAWACLGAVLLVPWWAGSLRRWTHDGTLGPRSVEQRVAGDPHIQRVRMFSQSPSRLPFSQPGAFRIFGMPASSRPTQLWRCT